MENHNSESDQILNNPNLILFHSFGLIDEIGLRNFVIKEEYKRLRKTHTQMDSIFTLSDKYGLSSDAINSILFRPRSKKPLSLNDVLVRSSN